MKWFQKYEIGLFLIYVSFSTLPTTTVASVKIGETEYVSISTPHPYPNGDSTQPVVWSHTITHPGATFIKVHFANMAIEGEMPAGPADIEKAFSKDYVSILDANGNEVDRLTGTGDRWAISVPGGTAIIELHADGQNAWYGFDIDQYGWGFMPIEPANCGFDGKTSICDTLFLDHFLLSYAVAYLSFQNDCDGSWMTCTGFLFAPEGFFMTNAHCVNSPTEAASTEVWFNYQRIDCAFPGRPIPDVFRCNFVLANCDLDFSVLKVFDPVKGNPAPIYGYMTLSDRVPAPGELIWEPQHPGGRPKEISEDGFVKTVPVEGVNPCLGDPLLCLTTPNGLLTDFGHRADDEPGSSGSPVLDVNNLVIGLAHTGGCLGTFPELGENGAVLMSEILSFISSCIDADEDGFIAMPCGNDCVDTDPAINPGSAEVCNDSVDNNCDGLVDCEDPDCWRDADGDGYVAQPCGNDCDDTNSSVNPGATEVCDNNKDDDCDGNSDCADAECALNPSCITCTDSDGDGYYVEAGCGTEVDCDDADANVHHGAVEVCGNNKDDDCDGAMDCDDGDCSGHPVCVAPEGCTNGVDDDGDGLVDCDDPDCINHTSCIPAIDINGIVVDGNLKVTVILDSKGRVGKDADWWAAALTPWGEWYWFTLDRWWVQSDTPISAYGGPLANIPPYTILDINTSLLPKETYEFYFGVDMFKNGTLDAGAGKLYYDRADVNITP